VNKMNFYKRDSNVGMLRLGKTAPYLAIRVSSIIRKGYTLVQHTYFPGRKLTSDVNCAETVQRLAFEYQITRTPVAVLPVQAV